MKSKKNSIVLWLLKWTVILCVLGWGFFTLFPGAREETWKELKENNIVKKINKKYGKEMTEVPTIVIIKDGKISSSYNIKENKYNIKLLEKYLEKEDVIND